MFSAEFTRTFYRLQISSICRCWMRTKNICITWVNLIVSLLNNSTVEWKIYRVILHTHFSYSKQLFFTETRRWKKMTENVVVDPVIFRISLFRTFRFLHLKRNTVSNKKHFSILRDFQEITNYIKLLDAKKEHLFAERTFICLHV